MNSSNSAVGTNRPESDSARGDSCFSDEKPRKTARSINGKRHRPITDEDLIADAAVEQILSTSEVAEFFDRSNQWLYWGLREKIFTYSDGTPILPEWIGEEHQHGRRRFNLSLVREIMKSCHRRGNLNSEQLKTITCRIMLAERGVEWREREGWRYVNLGRNRYRWVRPERACYDKHRNEWRLRGDAADGSGDSR